MSGMTTLQEISLTHKYNFPPELVKLSSHQGYAPLTIARLQCILCPFLGRIEDGALRLGLGVIIYRTYRTSIRGGIENEKTNDSQPNHTGVECLVGMNLFVLQGIAGDVSLWELTKACVPYWGVLCLGVVLIMVWPQIVLWHLPPR